VTYAWATLAIAAVVAIGMLWRLKGLPSSRSIEPACRATIPPAERSVSRPALKLFPEFDHELKPAAAYHLVEPSISE
jgi:hypothetical protein